MDFRTKAKLQTKTIPQIIHSVPAHIKDVVVWDEDLHGFGLRIQRGKKGLRASFVIQYRTYAGRTRRMTIGDLALPAADARKSAARELAKAKTGDDPQGEKVAKRRSGSNVFRAVAEEFIAYGEKNGIKSRPWRRETAKQYRLMLFKYYKPLHGMNIEAVTRGDISRLNNRILNERGRRSASIARARIWTFYNWCMGQGLVDINPVIGTTKIEYSETRERVLSDDELRRLWLACAPENFQFGGRFGDVIRMLILTGARRKEITGMRWSEIADGIFTLPAERSKNNREHKLPLPFTALAILERLSQQERWNGKGWASDGYVFSKLGSMNVERPQQKLIKDSGVTDWWIHDIRRSVATGMGRIGIQPHIVECVLNHVSGFRRGVAGVYNRHTYDPEVIQALTRWNEHILALAEGRPSKVVQLPRTA